MIVVTWQQTHEVYEVYLDFDIVAAQLCMEQTSTLFSMSTCMHKVWHWVCGTVFCKRIAEYKALISTHLSLDRPLNRRIYIYIYIYIYIRPTD